MKNISILFVLLSLTFMGCGGSEGGPVPVENNTNQFVVNFDSQGGSSVMYQYVLLGGQVKKPNNPIRAGYEFNMWLINGSPYNFSTPVSSSFTLVALWTSTSINEHIVTFDTQGGSSVSSQTVTSGEVVVKPTDPSKTDYAFNGWLLYSLPYDFSTPVTSDITLVASWLAKQVTNSSGMKFNYIPAGTFTMGAPSTDTDAADNEKPQHQVKISKAFYMGTYEVTQAQWQALMLLNPSYFNSVMLGTDSSNHPVEYISWDAVQNFLLMLNTKEPGVIYRLPTEAEWEYAARAGSTTIYPGGNDDISLSNYAWYGVSNTHPVGQKLPNAWGLYDMYGNVYEWVQDRSARTYTTAPVVDPEGPSAGSDRMLRGGGWASLAKYNRASYRTGYAPSSYENDLGFRVVREIN